MLALPPSMLAVEGNSYATSRSTDASADSQSLLNKANDTYIWTCMWTCIWTTCISMDLYIDLYVDLYVDVYAAAVPIRENNRKYMAGQPSHWRQPMVQSRVCSS